MITMQFDNNLILRLFVLNCQNRNYELWNFIRFTEYFYDGDWIGSYQIKCHTLYQIVMIKVLKMDGKNW